jgi:putative membrane protein
MKSIIKNPVALLIVLGLCIIPSLYAWVNIKACWDPYENTSTIPVAIVNNDKGASFKGKSLNMGAQIVTNLKANHKIGWIFVNSKDANMGIVDGTYNALIEIPDNFTSSFTSILTNKPKRPEIIYKVDTKANPVAGKITGIAKDTLTDQITTGFISTVNKTIFSSLNEVGNDASKNKDNILKLKDNIINVNNNMDFITASLESISGNSNNLTTFLSKIKSNMPDVDNSLSIISESNDQNKNILQQTQNTLNNSFNNMQLNLNSAEVSIYRIQALVNSINTNFSASNLSAIYSSISNINMELENLNNSISSAIDFLQKINTTTSNADIANIITSLKNIQNSISSEKSNLNDLQKQLLSNNKVNKDLLASLNNNTSSLNNQMISVDKQYNSSTKLALNSIAKNMTLASSDASSLIKSAQGLNTEISNLLETAANGTNLSTKVSSDLNNKISQYKDVISLLSTNLQTVNNKDLVEIISILQSNPDFMGNFISNPFNIKDESIYHLPNYGSGMAPVYTVLAIWVGTLLLVSLLKTEAVYFDGYNKLSLREKHFGKMLTFITLSLIQSFIVSIGDKVLLGVYTVNAPLMVAFALMSGFTFSVIVYTLVSVLGNIGKAVSIIFLIIQLAGSGATYPIQVDPLFFRILQPLFPFTYSVGGFREAIAGPLISTVILDFTALILTSVLFILFGFFFKKPLHETISKFQTGFKESGIGE